MAEDRRFSFGTFAKNAAASAGTTAKETVKGAFMTTPTALGIRAVLGAGRGLRDMGMSGGGGSSAGSGGAFSTGQVDDSAEGFMKAQFELQKKVLPAINKNIMTLGKMTERLSQLVQQLPKALVSELASMAPRGAGVVDRDDDIIDAEFTVLSDGNTKRKNKALPTTELATTVKSITTMGGGGGAGSEVTALDKIEEKRESERRFGFFQDGLFGRLDIIIELLKNMGGGGGGDDGDGGIPIPLLPGRRVPKTRRAPKAPKKGKTPKPKGPKGADAPDAKPPKPKGPKVADVDAPKVRDVDAPKVKGRGKSALIGGALSFLALKMGIEGAGKVDPETGEVVHDRMPLGDALVLGLNTGAAVAIAQDANELANAAKARSFVGPRMADDVTDLRGGKVTDTVGKALAKTKDVAGNLVSVAKDAASKAPGAGRTAAVIDSAKNIAKDKAGKVADTVKDVASKGVDMVKSAGKVVGKVPGAATAASVAGGTARGVGGVARVGGKLLGKALLPLGVAIGAGSEGFNAYARAKQSGASEGEAVAEAALGGTLGALDVFNPATLLTDIGSFFPEDSFIGRNSRIAGEFMSVENQIDGVKALGDPLFWEYVSPFHEVGGAMLKEQNERLASIKDKNKIWPQLIEEAGGNEDAAKAAYYLQMYHNAQVAKQNGDEEMNYNMWGTAQVAAKGSPDDVMKMAENLVKYHVAAAKVMGAGAEFDDSTGYTYNGKDYGWDVYKLAEDIAAAEAVNPGSVAGAGEAGDVPPVGTGTPTGNMTSNGVPPEQVTAMSDASSPALDANQIAGRASAAGTATAGGSLVATALPPTVTGSNVSGPVTARANAEAISNTAAQREAAERQLALQQATTVAQQQAAAQAKATIINNNANSTNTGGHGGGGTAMAVRSPGHDVNRAWIEAQKENAKTAVV